jgi:hypothetical protein
MQRIEAPKRNSQSGVASGMPVCILERLVARDFIGGILAKYLQYLS